MKLMTARRLAALEFDCEAWAKLEPSASVADAGRGVLDRYSVALEQKAFTREAVAHFRSSVTTPSPPGEWPATG
ncbi:MAG: hypothetical protein HYV62_12655 [Candidatus Rokubacteria bacterium]|nr:hypothetical protein [Candidatus Rokubacteria bacterium]